MQRREGDEELDASSDLWATLDTYADGEDDQTDETDMNVNDFWIPRVSGSVFDNQGLIAAHLVLEILSSFFQR